MPSLEAVKNGGAASGSAASTAAVPPLSAFLKAIPKHCFVKSLPHSMFYAVRDMGIWAASVVAYDRFCKTNPEPAALVAGTVAYWLVSGLMMWCVFVVGHECGHTTFSEYPVLNAIVGHAMHAPLLVPFWPWKLSHSRHHSHHNHKTDDYSHPWWNASRFSEWEWINWFVAKASIPMIGWPMYIFAGQHDGSHVTPFDFFGGKLWDDATWLTRLQTAVSSAAVYACMYAIGFMCDFDAKTVAVRYGASYVGFSWWLYTVTYLQHHDDTTDAYEGKDWNFVKGGLETIDRKYGLGIDNFMHNITDGHVVHHLFSKKIPHYNLLEATEAIRPLIEPKGLYKLRDNTLSGEPFFSCVWRTYFDYQNYVPVEFAAFVAAKKKTN